MIRRFKPAYEFYNLFHRGELMHNKALYAKYGVNKNYYSSISSEDFSHLDADKILQEGRQEALTDIPFYQEQASAEQENLRAFDQTGHVILPGFLSEDTVAEVNATIEELVSSKRLTFKYGNKLMFAIDKEPKLRAMWEDKALLRLLDHLIMGSATLFQSINFINGSEQKTHSDSIHMTTFPHGGLLGVWVALEDITPAQGPIHYYPGSHLLPYYMNRDYDNVGSRFFLGDKGYQAYETMIARKVKEKQIEKKVFTAKAGDLFIWHANLLHGGEPHTDKGKTRKSMVMHYFDARRICYHEITQRPALMKEGI